jgi:hypothetical protein
MRGESMIDERCEMMMMMMAATAAAATAAARRQAMRDERSCADDVLLWSRAPRSNSESKRHNFQETRG